MSYQVLARKYRSATFDELVGQEAVATTLKNAILAGRVHHGYLFTGTRGVGKTSAARILAKALNCLSFDQPTATPCRTCDACLRIAEGEDIDVVEIDAASNTGVDDIRVLRGNTAFRPARSRFKIYIIDEVHMLSTAAFNALLKTLEEPPEHVKFVLATTELIKVPATIQSRCQRFDFKALPPAQIAEQLDRILRAENIRAQPEVVRRIARLANGSMRDALSLLDKVLSFGGDDLTTALLDELLPPALDEWSYALVDRLAAGDAAAALDQLDDAAGAGQTLERLCDLLIDHMRKLMLVRVCGADTEIIDVPESLRDRFAQQSAAFDPPVYVYMITLLEELRRSLRSSGAGRALADAALVRLAMAPQFADIRTLLAGQGAAGSPSTAPAARAAPAPPPPGLQAEKKKPDTPAIVSERTARSQRLIAPSAAEAAPAPGPVVAAAIPAQRSAPAHSDPPPSVSDEHTTRPSIAAAGVGEALLPGLSIPGPGPAGRPSAAQADEMRKTAMRHPLVREAMARFDARLVDVLESADATPPADAPPRPSPDPSTQADTDEAAPEDPPEFKEPD